ncbi:MAG: hypothetical protein JSS66_04915 [Armatimonadetes bacterium]|nr:hypothetical protein [Armatimonadota bacterium]
MDDPALEFSLPTADDVCDMLGGLAGSMSSVMMDFDTDYVLHVTGGGRYTGGATPVEVARSSYEIIASTYQYGHMLTCEGCKKHARFNKRFWVEYYLLAQAGETHKKLDSAWPTGTAEAAEAWKSNLARHEQVFMKAIEHRAKGMEYCAAHELAVQELEAENQQAAPDDEPATI